MSDAIEALGRMVLLCRDFADPSLSDEAIGDAFQRRTVSFTADAANLQSPAGQAALVAYVSLVARMGIQVRLDIPELPIVGYQPPLDGTRLRQGLVELGADLIPGTSVESDGDSDIAFILGDSPAPSISTSASWRLIGGGWIGSISPAAVEGTCWTGSWPIGALTSAALAAAETFKAVLRNLPLGDPYYSRFLRPIWAADWDFGSPLLDGNAVNLGPVEIISAGAITQAALFTLFRIPGIVCDARIFDDDVTDLSNLNRNVLTRRRDVERLKVDVIKAFDSSGFTIDTVDQRYTERLASVLRSNRRTLVGVDDIPSRWRVQRATEGWLGVSGTSHFEVSSSHDDGEPCAGCLHHIDDTLLAGPIPTVSFVSFLAGLSLAVRIVHHALGHGYGPNQQHLWLSALRMDNTAGLWSLVAPRKDCPVRCWASRR